MGQFRYVTNRTLRNKNDEEKGRLRAFVRTGSDTAEGDYECPECGDKGKINQVWKRPFTVRCQKCNFLMKIPKMKDQMKKDKKKARK